MTKSLTEKWKDGELEMITYYVRLKNERICRCLHTGSKMFMRTIDGLEEQVQEVLAPVPSYEEYKQLQEQLKIATRALKGISVWANTGNGGEMAVKKIVEKALKEIENVK